MTGRGPRKVTLRRIVFVVAILGVVSVPAVLGALNLASAARSLDRAENLISGVSGALKDGRIEDARALLSSARSDVNDANESLRSTSLALAAVMPVIGQNLTSLQDSVELAAVAVHGGERILDSAASLEGPDGTLEVSLSQGTVPVEEIASARLQMSKLLAQLPGQFEPETSRLLFPPVKRAHDLVGAELASLRLELERLDRGLVLLSDLVGADRPSRYLLAVSNTAEMRGSGGMVLNYGVLEGHDGVVDLADFGRVEELQVQVPVPPSDAGLPDDYVERWEGFDVTREWRNATMSADLRTVAPVLEAMYRRATGRTVDGVIQIDPGGLAAVLAAVGPVEVPEVGTVTSENVQALVLNDAYRLFPGVEERTDILGDVAEAAFTRLVEGEFPSVRTLAEQISDAVAARHIIVHAARSDVQTAVEYFGASGALPDMSTLDTMHLTVQNLSGNKLDYYVDTSVEIVGERPTGEIGALQVTITVENTAPRGETVPRYIFGPYGDLLSAGVYRSAVSLYLPTGTSLTGSSGAPFILEPRMLTEGGRAVAGYWIDVAAGETSTVTLDLRLPPVPEDGGYELTIVPSPRVRPTTYNVGIATDDGVVSGELEVAETWILRPAELPIAVPPF